MAITSVIKNAINSVLGNFNLKIETLILDKLESQRLISLESKGLLDKPIFSIPDSFKSDHYKSILAKVQSYHSEFAKFISPTTNSVKYSYDNGYFSSPDTEILYTIVRHYSPEKVIEIGCGNSTKIIRQAIIDGDLTTKLISIDPNPRLDIKEYSDEICLQPVENLADNSIFEDLKSGDILFIDSSHLINTGNDVVFLYTNIIPRLVPGVIIHIHDIFLPYDYPKSWVIDKKITFNEQYLVQCILTFSNQFEVLWAGYFLQKTLPNFSDYFTNLGQRNSQSLWLRKI